MDYAKLLLSGRVARSMTQAQAAEMLGITERAVRAIERGESQPRTELRGAIARLGGVSENALPLASFDQAFRTLALLPLHGPSLGLNMTDEEWRREKARRPPPGTPTRRAQRFETRTFGAEIMRNRERAERARLGLSARQMDTGSHPQLVNASTGDVVTPLLRASALAVLGVEDRVADLAKLHVPQIESRPGVTDVAEGENVTEGVLLTSRSDYNGFTAVTDCIRVTRRLRNQTSYMGPFGIASVVEGLALDAMAKHLEKRALTPRTDSARQPESIADLATQAPLAGPIAVDDIEGSVRELEDAGVNTPAIAAVCSPTTKAELQKLAHGTGFAWRRDPASPTGESLLGYPAYASDEISDASLILGDFGQCRVLLDETVDLRMWLGGNIPGLLDAATDESATFAWLDYDLEVMHPKAFQRLVPA